MEECCESFFLFLFLGWVRIAAILDILRACALTRPRKTLLLRRARLPLVVDSTWHRSRQSSAIAVADRTIWRGMWCRRLNVFHLHLFFALVTCSDCLAPPYSTTEDMNGVKEPVETCYKCKEPGHVCVSHLRSTMSSWVLVMYILYCL